MMMIKLLFFEFDIIKLFDRYQVLFDEMYEEIGICCEIFLFVMLMVKVVLVQDMYEVEFFGG